MVDSVPPKRGLVNSDSYTTASLWCLQVNLGGLGN